MIRRVARQVSMNVEKIPLLPPLKAVASSDMFGAAGAVIRARYALPLGTFAHGHHCSKLLHDIKVAYLEPELVDFPINDAKNNDTALADPLPHPWNAQPANAIGAPSGTPHDERILSIDHVVNLPLGIAKGLMIPVKRALELLAAALHREVVWWMRDEIVGDQCIEGREVAVRPEVIKPAPHQFLPAWVSHVPSFHCGEAGAISGMSPYLVAQ